MFTGTSANKEAQPDEKMQSSQNIWIHRNTSYVIQGLHKNNAGHFKYLLNRTWWQDKNKKKNPGSQRKFQASILCILTMFVARYRTSL
jgi:hypothetical protein